MEKVSVFWFRRDLRLEHNTGLIEALEGEHPVLPVFIFDPEILDELPEDDARLTFIYSRLMTLREHLEKNHGTSIALYHKRPLEVFQCLRNSYELKEVFTNRDYEPYAGKRDGEISEYLRANGISFHTFKDQVIFEKDEVVKDNGDPYVVYTPYMKRWKEHFDTVRPFEGKGKQANWANLHKDTDLPCLSLQAMGFKESGVRVPDYDVSTSMIRDYEKTRNFPSREGTSRLGPHLRFGTVSVREMVKKAMGGNNQTFLNELIWREFFMQILWHYPHTTKESFKKKYDRIPWRNNTEEFEKWKKGETGYALVDAGMRQLNTTGYMHNRVRMLVASFLCKHLLIDWRWGEAYFAQKLLDYELSSNVGNWQWAAGSGVDAAPYFRIFNPMTQIDKFDKERKYIEQWVPEAGTEGYVPKIVDHKEARERCLETYRSALS